MRAVTVGVMVGMLALGAGDASAASWRASIDTPFPAFASNTSGSGSPHTVVADGRVWWLSYGGRYSSPTYPVVLRSRSLSSGTARKLQLDTSALAHPASAVDAAGRTTEFPQPSVQQFKVRDGRVYVIGGWGPAPGTDGPGAGQAFYAAFSTQTGKPVLDEPIPVSQGGGFGRHFVDGDPAVLALETSGAASSGPLLDPATSAALPVDAADVREVAGRFALSLAPTDRHDDTQIRGTGTATVRDLRTGKTRYRLTAREIARAAGGSSSVEVGLNSDGSLRTTVNARGARPLHAVVVDSSGRVRQIGRPLRRVGSIAAVRDGHRAFVHVDGVGRDGRSALWVVSDTGKRGRRLPLLDAKGYQRRSLPSAWAGDHAVWETSGPKDQSGIWVQTHVSGVSLSTRDVPSERAVR